MPCDTLCTVLRHKHCYYTLLLKIWNKLGVVCWARHLKTPKDSSQGDCFQNLTFILEDDKHFLSFNINYPVSYALFHCRYLSPLIFCRKTPLHFMGGLSSLSLCTAEILTKISLTRYHCDQEMFIEFEPLPCRTHSNGKFFLCISRPRTNTSVSKFTCRIKPGQLWNKKWPQLLFIPFPQRKSARLMVPASHVIN